MNLPKKYHGCVMKIRRSHRRCVFCGGSPQHKNNEHVLPRWLIEWTGNPKRLVTCELHGRRSTSLSFNKLRFPACETCNEAFSELERSVASFVRHLPDLNLITEEQALQLLDWIDKVRVGLWLGGIMMTRNPLGTQPRFAINQRMAAVDRVLYLGLCRDAVQALRVGLMTDPLFMSAPSSLLLLANDLSLISYSSSHCAAPALGLPRLISSGTRMMNGQVFMEGDVIAGAGALDPELLPVPRRGFSVLAQAVPDSPAFPLTDGLREDYISQGASTDPSRVALFSPAASPHFLGEEGSEVFAPPIRTQTDSDIAAVDVYEDIRARVANVIPMPEPGADLFLIHTVGMMERSAPGSSMLFRDRIGIFSDRWLDVMWGRCTQEEWESFLREEARRASEKALEERKRYPRLRRS